MPTSPNRINLVIDDTLQEILNIMRLAYPALKDSELIKMAISGYFSLKIDEFERFLVEPTSTSANDLKRRKDMLLFISKKLNDFER
ncbi:MAG: hypothetical protein OHK0017_07500 [Patescibacteria group bacterium]